MHCARWTAKKPSWVYDSGDFWGEGILLCLDWKLGRCHSQVPTARQHAANGCNRDGQMSRTGVLYSSNSSAATGARPRYLRSPKTAATRRIRQLVGIQLHKSTLASQGGGRPRERATGSGGQTSQACQPSSTVRSEGTQKESSWLVCAGTARRLHLLGGPMYPQFSGTSEGMAEPVPI